MSVPLIPKPAKLVISILLKDKTLLSPLLQELEAEYGNADFLSSWFPFDFTKYYADEMGGPLFRRMLAFSSLIEQKELSKIKTLTNQIEKRLSDQEKRKVNIDPGYLLLERFVLATGKNFTHRIYIGLGIYADLTLIYQKGDFRALPWTYPDYKDEQMLSFLRKARNRYIDDLKRFEFTDNRPFDTQTEDNA